MAVLPAKVPCHQAVCDNHLLLGIWFIRPSANESFEILLDSTTHVVLCCSTLWICMSWLGRCWFY